MLKISQAQDYREILKGELERRCANNGRYSLRAFARDLAMPVSHLSEVLRGKHGISASRAQEIATKLDLSPRSKAIFCGLVESSDARSATVRDQASLRVRRLKAKPAYTRLQLDIFRIISDWHHFAILELALTSSFENSPRWIGQRLGIPEIFAKEAVERLKRLGQLKADTKGKLRPTDAFLATTDGVPSEHLRKFHRQLLDKAIAALETQGVDQRDSSAMVFAVHPDRIPEAKLAIRDFRRSFNAEFSQDRTRTEVYCLSLQFFKLSEGNVP